MCGKMYQNYQCLYNDAYYMKDVCTIFYEACYSRLDWKNYIEFNAYRNKILCNGISYLSLVPRCLVGIDCSTYITKDYFDDIYPIISSYHAMFPKYGKYVSNRFLNDDNHYF